MNAPNLRQAAFSGLFWTGLSNYGGQALQLLTTLVLAALLVPADFGTFALASLFVALLGLVRGLGLGEALIQWQGDIKEAADTAFWLQLGLGGILFAVSFASAPLAAGFFDNAEIAPIIRVLSIPFLLFALQSTHMRLLQKELRFRTNAIPGVIGSISYAAAALALAWRGWGVWSIVYGTLVSSAIATAVYWLVSSYRPGLRFNWPTARGLLGFGGFAQANTFLIFLHRLIDKAAVGRFVGTTATGFYDFSFRIGNLPESRITFLFYGVAFPLYAQLRSDPARLARVHLLATRYLATIVAPLALAIAAIGPTAIEGLYGDKWLPAVPALVILSVYGLASGVLGAGGIVFYAMGRPQLLTWIDGTKILVIIASIYFFAINWGFVGVAILMTAANVVSGIAILFLTSRLLSISAMHLARQVVIPLGVAAVTLVAPLFLLYMAPLTLSLLTQAILAALAYFFVYGTAVYFLDPRIRSQTQLFLGSPRQGLEALLREGTA